MSIVTRAKPLGPSFGIENYLHRSFPELEAYEIAAIIYLKYTTLLVDTFCGFPNAFTIPE